jgi:uncharacterized membrane protein YfcA
MILQAAAAASPPSDSSAVVVHNALFATLAVFTGIFLVVLVQGLRKRAAAGDTVKTPLSIWAVSFVANFFDTLGIGSYATTTTMFRHWKLVRDERIPGTLNVGYVLPTVVQAFIYTTIVPVDPTTLILMIGSAVLGAWLGAGVVSGWSRRSVQLGMGLCLLGFVVIKVFSQLGIGPAAGMAVGLTGTKLAIGVVGNFVLGALMTLGIGLYAPCIILIGLLGMSPITAYPIMMGSCAFLMPMASVRFVRTGSFDPRAIIGMLLSGIPAVLIAAFIVKTMPLNIVMWLVLVVVTYTGVNMLLAARRERSIASDATAAEAQPA